MFNGYDLSDNNKLIVPCDFSGLVRKIVIIGSDKDSKYLLLLCGHDCCNGKYDCESEAHIFNFEEKTDTLKTFINAAVLSNEPEIVERQNYINFDKIDRVAIQIERNRRLPLKVYLYGYDEKYKMNSIHEYDIVRYNADPMKYTIKKI